MGIASALILGMIAKEMKPMLQGQMQGQQQSHQQQNQQQGYGGPSGAGGYGSQQVYQQQQGQANYGNAPGSSYQPQYTQQPQQGYGNDGFQAGYHPSYTNQAPQYPQQPQYNPNYDSFPGPSNGGGMPFPGTRDSGSMPMPGSGGMSMPGQGYEGNRGDSAQGERGDRDHHYGAYAAGALGVAAVGYGAYQYQQHHQQGYGAPPMMNTYGGSGPVDYNRVLQILQRGVQDQNLYAFYPQGSLEPLAQRIVQSNALPQLASEWKEPIDKIIELARLALFDIILYVDDSGSMRLAENGERIEDLGVLIKRFTSAACLFDTDGLTIRFMHSEGAQVSSHGAAEDLISRVRFHGDTPMGTELWNRVLEPFVVEPAKRGTLRKPVYIITLTDGEPSEPRDTFVQMLKRTQNELRNTRYGPDAVSYGLAQLGNDDDAYRFLNEIDQGEVGNVIDVTSDYEREAENVRTANPSAPPLTPDGWVMKLLLGGISSSFDGQDERRQQYGGY